MVKRIFDLILSSLLLMIILLPSIFIFLIVKLSSAGPAIYWSERVGLRNKNFYMPKFRTMKINTPETATHLLQNAEQFYTTPGKMLRKYSLDEIPQIYSVLISDMSLVGPRPALYNQEDLVNSRTINYVHELKPGITGWAQVNGRDELSIEEKVKFDAEYLSKKSLRFDLYIIWLTLLKVIKKDGISH